MKYTSYKTAKKENAFAGLVAESQTCSTKSAKSLNLSLQVCSLLVLVGLTPSTVSSQQVP